MNKYHDIKNESMSKSVYDTSFILSLDNEFDLEKKGAMIFLLNSQKSDGSWGSDFYFLPDRIVNTLAVLANLESLKIIEERFILMKDRAMKFCLDKIDLINDEERRPVAFEAILPFLWKKVFGNKKNDVVDFYEKKFSEKLRVLPLEVVFSSPSTLMHTLEVFDQKKLPWEKIKKLLSTNGCMGNSPASTIFYHNNNDDLRSKKFLKKTIGLFKYTLPVNYPIDIFEVNWILYFNYILSNLSQSKQKKFINFIKKNWSNKIGISWSEFFPVPDLDDTSISFVLLSNYFDDINPIVFDRFVENGEVFCFPGETQPSVTHLSHFVEAISGKNIYRKELEFAMDFIIKKQHTNGMWLDKWHVSPYYATSQVLLSCAEKLSFDSLKLAHQWILDSKNYDNGWGLQGSSKEESAYAILSLNKIKTILGGEGPKNSVIKAFNENNYLPDLWIDKNLYTPYNIVNGLFDLIEKYYE